MALRDLLGVINFIDCGGSIIYDLYEKLQRELLWIGVYREEAFVVISQ